LFEQAHEILLEDPINVGRRYNIAKLKGVAAGYGQYRLRLGRFRFRYDVAGGVVELLYRALRPEDTYRGWRKCARSLYALDTAFQHGSNFSLLSRRIAC